MLAAYFDDSGDPTHGAVVAAGGLFTTEQHWTQFCNAWKHATRHLNRPFHSTDCECGHGEFADWPKTKRDRLFEELCGLVKDFNLGGFGSAVLLEDFRKAFPAAAAHDPYYLCAGLCLANLAEIARVSSSLLASGPWGIGDVYVRYVFEHNPITSRRVTEIHDALRALPWTSGKLMAGIEHGGKDHVGLQAADLVAREVFKFQMNRGRRLTRKPLLALARNVTVHWWEPGQLNSFASALKQSSYAELLANTAQQITKAPGSPITLDSCLG